MRRSRYGSTASIEVDIDEYIDHASDEAVRKEYKERFATKSDIDISIKQQTFQLELAAIELRKMGNISYAVWLEDIAKGLTQ
jgi:tRNA threonylcarbamoyladenosine modification (KEOPS) complex  Pcc1 subunit